MENLELTFEEQIEIERRGFFVKEILNKKQYFITLLSYLCVYMIWALTLMFWILIIWSSIAKYSEVVSTLILNWMLTKYYYASLFGMILLYLYITLKFWVFRYLMQSENAYIINNESYQYIDQIPTRYFDEKQKINNLWWKFLEYLKNPWISYSRNLKDAIWNFLIWLLMICLTWIILILNIILFIVGIMIMKLMEYIIPTSYFIKLWVKIQTLTPQIEEQSKQIQSEFSSDMNFSTLSAGFDSLSNTFSKIVWFVIKLEKVEARANKWNLFDSEKYINSLRSDIVEPLKSLKEFLEDQKNKLLESQKELIQVRVWGSEESGNTELASKRSESLIMELTENIEKLDVMIGKMGK